MNGNIFKDVIIFVAGGAIGTFVTYKLLNRKYELRIQDEIASIKEVFSKREPLKDVGPTPYTSENVKQNIEKAEKAKEKPDLNEYVNKIQRHGYVNYSEIKSTEQKGTLTPVEPGEEVIANETDEYVEYDLSDNEKSDHPYLIDADEFADQDDYETVGLNYFSDGILADENDERIDEIAKVVGTDFINVLGKDDEDSVFVRNDIFKCDYEILYDKRKYADVIRKKRPHQIEE